MANGMVYKFTMAIIDDTTETNLQGFVRDAKRMLAQPVGELATRTRRADRVRSMPISDADPAYRAAVVMRRHRLDWLDVYDTDDIIVGTVEREALDDVFKILDVSPFLGEEMMAAILPLLEAVELEHS
jgi:hypothetical protein